MNTNFIKSATLVTGLLLSGSIMAQDTEATVPPFSPASSFRTWSLGIHAGASAPLIPLGKNDFLNWEVSMGYGAYIKKQITPVFGIRADYFRGTVKADNDRELSTGGMPNRPNYAFKTDVNWSASLGGEVTLGSVNWLIKQTTIQPYLTAGAGFIAFQPQTSNVSGAPLASYTTGKDNIHHLVVPVGLGMKFNLSPTINFDLGYTMNFIDGDDFDGTFFADDNDKFSYAHAGLEFALGDVTKPQLSRYNPAAAMSYDNMVKNQALRDQLNADLATKLAAEQAANAAKLAQMQADLQRALADADGDGVSDHFDKCPGTPAGTKVDGSGCPLVTPAPVTNTVIITEEDRRIVSEAIKNLEFDFNKATIRSTSFASLNRVAELLIAKSFSLKLAGHTDSKGSDAYNLALSKDRAESVKAYLVSKGANPSRIEATGYGESQPIATNNTEAGRQKNRRVEFTLY